jgi:hypothetical protein
MPAPPRPRPTPGLSGAPPGPPPAAPNAHVPVSGLQTLTTTSTPQSPEPLLLHPEFVEEDVPLLPKRRSLWPLTLVVLITGLVLVVAVAATTASGPSVQNSAPMPPFEPVATTAAARPPSPTADPSQIPKPAESSESPAPARSLSPAAPAVTAPAPSGDSTTGTLDLPAWTKGHRIYLDGRVVGEGPGPLRVRCGPHLIRLGSTGRELSTVVPCGGEMRVR